MNDIRFLQRGLLYWKLHDIKRWQPKDNSQ